MQVKVRRVSIPLDEWAPPCASVLFVSPCADYRAAVSRVLTQSGLPTVTAAHGGHALLECIRNPGFDVLLLDERVERTSQAIVSGLQRRCRGMRVVRLGGPDETAMPWPPTSDALLELLQAVPLAPSSERPRS